MAIQNPDCPHNRIQHRAAINSAAHRLQLLDDLHGRTLGAPLSVPAGKHAASAASASRSPRNCPSSAETRCMTWEYFSTYIRSRTFTLPYSLTRPSRSVPGRPASRARRVPFRQCATLGKALVLAASAPRLRVPAIGRYSSFRPDTRTSISGDAPTT